MGPTLELDTVSHEEKCRPSRRYEFDEPKRGALSNLIGSVIGLGAAVYAQRLLWGAEGPHRPPDYDDLGQDRVRTSPESAIMPSQDGDRDPPPVNSRASIASMSATSADGISGELAADENQGEQARPRGSGAVHANAMGRSDVPHQAAGDNTVRSAGPSSEGRSPQPSGGGGGGGGGGGDAPRSQQKTSGGQAGDGKSGGTNPSESNPGGTPGPTGNPAQTPSGAGANRAPVVSGPVVLKASVMNMAVSITLAALLQHASDPDGDALAVVGLVANSGDLRVAGDGSWTLTPASGDDTKVDFHYFVSDGEAQTAQTASLDLLPGPPPSDPVSDSFAGTPGADVMSGTPQADVIDAKGGNDVVDAGAGNDIVYGGDGNDVLHGGSGDDIIYAGAGDDIVFGGDGNDIIFAGDGNDLVFADAGNDIVYGNAGHDVIHGGSGDDILNGGDGADLLVGDEGHDRIYGDSGDDTIVATVGDGDDMMDGGDGIDVYDLSATSHGLVVDLGLGTSIGEETGTDTLVRFENVVGGSGDDTLIGDDGANVLSGGQGDDWIVGAGGSDNLSGGAGNDTFAATMGDGNDVMDGGAGIDTYDLSATRNGVFVDLRAGIARGAETGTDDLSGIENVVGGTGDDAFVADSQRNVFFGGAGADTFVIGRADGDGNPEHWDQIRDFSVGDRIDVSLRPFGDSDAAAVSLEFEGPYDAEDDSPQSRGGKLEFSLVQSDDGEHTLVVGWSVDGNAEVVQVDLCGYHDLSPADFIGVH